MYLADHQWAGRGRNQKRWYNGAPGTCFLVSLTHQQEEAPSYLLPARLGLTLYLTLTLCWPSLPWRLKAPNDIYLGEGKVAGLLLELLQKGKTYFLILGLGMNVFPSSQRFTNKDLNLPPISYLQAFLEKPLSQLFWRRFLKEVYSKWQKSCQSLPKGRLFLKEQKELLSALNAHHKEKVYKKVDEQGNLYLTDGRQVPWQNL